MSLEASEETGQSAPPAESAPPKPVIAELSQIEKAYGEGENKVAVLKGINLTVQAGDAISVVGPSGCGKSTLLNLIGALDRPSSGTILIGGEDLSRRDENQLAELRNDRIGFVFQSHHLLPQLNVLENALLPTWVHPKYKDNTSAVDRAKELIEQVGLSHRLGHLPGQLSGGERQRVAVVRALINEPDMLLADEPTGALDQTTAREIASLLIELNQNKGTALIMVTHDQGLASEMKRKLKLDEGKLVD